MNREDNSKEITKIDVLFASPSKTFPNSPDFSVFKPNKAAC
jgi:hypothetical protein